MTNRRKPAQPYSVIRKRPRYAADVFLAGLAAALEFVRRIWRQRLELGLILVFGALVYSSTIRYPFVFDDIPQIQQNEHLRIRDISLVELGRVFWSSPLRSRPVPYVSFAIDRYLGQGSELPFHLTNIALHLLNSLLVYGLVHVTLDQMERTATPKHPWLTPRLIRTAALIAALVFCLHPIQIQSVTYIVQRMNSMATLFYLGGLAFYIGGRRARSGRRRWTFWTLGLFVWLVSLMCKQIAITLPFVVLLYEWYFFQDLSWAWLRRGLIRFAAVFAVLILVAVVYLYQSGWQKILNNYNNLGFTMTERLLTQPRVLGIYALLTLLPIPSQYNLLHDVETSTGWWSPPSTTVAIVGLGVYVLTAILLARRHRLASFCLLWPIIHLVVESSVIPLEMIYEHRMYLPMVGLVLGFGYFWIWLMRTWPASGRMALVLGLALPLGVATYVRNLTWQDPLVLWRDVIAKSPNLARPYVNRGGAYARMGEWPLAIDDFRRALVIEPEYDMAWLGRGSAYARTDRPLQAIKDFTEAIDHAWYPEVRALAYRNRGAAYASLENHEKAIEDYTSALEWSASDTLARLNRGNAYRRLNQLSKAIDDYAACIDIDPRFAMAYNNLAASLIAADDPAIRNPKRALQAARTGCELTGYREWNLLDTLASAYAANREFDRAADWQAKAVEEAPDEHKPYLRERLKGYRTRASERGS